MTNKDFLLQQGFIVDPFQPDPDWIVYTKQHISIEESSTDTDTVLFSINSSNHDPFFRVDVHSNQKSVQGDYHQIISALISAKRLLECDLTEI